MQSQVSLNRYSLNGIPDSFINETQLDLNEVYRTTKKRSRRTSYNLSYVNPNDIPGQDGLTVIRRASWFTQSQQTDVLNTKDRKSFYRPKTPVIELNDRRRILQETCPNYNSNNKDTISTYNKIQERTNNLINLFKNNNTK
jgi:hypothetical protein